MAYDCIMSNRRAATYRLYSYLIILKSERRIDFISLKCALNESQKVVWSPLVLIFRCQIRFSFEVFRFMSDGYEE